MLGSQGLVNAGTEYMNSLVQTILAVVKEHSSVVMDVD